MLKLKRGFTLIELLVVIGILAILLAITLIAINPAHQFGQANNTRRRSDVLQILNAVHQYTAEHGGSLPDELTKNLAATYFNDTTSLKSLCAKLMPVYLPALPVEPSLKAATNITDCKEAGDKLWGTTGYQISTDDMQRVTVISPVADNGETIEVTR